MLRKFKSEGGQEFEQDYAPGKNSDARIEGRAGNRNILENPLAFSVKFYKNK